MLDENNGSRFCGFVWSIFSMRYSMHFQDVPIICSYNMSFRWVSSLFYYHRLLKEERYIWWIWITNSLLLVSYQDLNFMANVWFTVGSSFPFFSFWMNGSKPFECLKCSNCARKLFSSSLPICLFNFSFSPLIISWFFRLFLMLCLGKTFDDINSDWHNARIVTTVINCFILMQNCPSMHQIEQMTINKCKSTTNIIFLSLTFF